MKFNGFTLLCLTAVCGLTFSAAAGAVSPAAPDYYPSCPTPQPVSPLLPAGGTYVGRRTAVVWNGSDYATLWQEGYPSYSVKFRRYFADGTPVAPAVAVASAYYMSPGLVWNGTGYGIAYFTPGFTFNFARLDTNGVMIGVPVVMGTVSSAFTAGFISLAWSGSNYAAVWLDARTVGATSGDIYGALMNSDGTIAGGGTLHDLVISNAANMQTDPAIAWSASGGTYVAVWNDNRIGPKTEIYQSTLSTAGVVSANLLLVTGAGSSTFPAIADSGSSLGLVWSDTRDGNNEIYMTTLQPAGGRASGDVRLTNDVGVSDQPALAWSGSEFGLFWVDNRGGAYDVWFQRASPTGVATGGAVQISASGGGLRYPSAAFGHLGYFTTATAAYGNTVNFVQSVGCATVSAPPSCPANFLAYNITGTTASVSWSPSGDPVSEFAYYQVYRNNTPIGKTSSPYYNDSGLPLSSTNNYMIQPVNAAQLQNYNCTSSIYVRTNATLTLTMNKATTANAGLAWTDAYFNNYNIFRGTRPQVMSQIGATPSLSTQDPNVLTDTLSYFYSVDNPGP